MCRVVDRAAGQAEVGGCRFTVLIRNGSRGTSIRRDLTALLRRVVLVGQPALRLRLDVERIGLRAVDRRPHLVVTT
jgi:hypothetical protein